MRPHRRCAQLAVPAAAVVAVLLAPLGVSAAAGASVSIVDSPPASTCSGYSYCFDPASVHVDPGGTVTWTSNSKVAHTVSADDGSFNSGDLAATQTFQRTFPTSGTYTYHCNIHTYMHGTVVVGSGSPPPPPTSSPPPPPTVNPRASNAPTAAPTATPRNTATAPTPTAEPPSPTPATTAAVSPTLAPLADAGGAPTAAPTSGGGALPAAGTASTGASGGGGGAAGPVLGGVAAVLIVASTALVLHRRRRSFTKIR